MNILHTPPLTMTDAHSRTSTLLTPPFPSLVWLRINAIKIPHFSNSSYGVFHQHRLIIIAAEIILLT